MHQQITIIGNLGGDPELQYTPNGKAVCNFSIAANRTYTKNDEQVKETTWFRVSVWGKQGENCNEYLRKGSLVYVTGRLKPDPDTGGPRVWDGKASYEVDANPYGVLFLSKSSDPREQEYDEQDEIPF